VVNTSANIQGDLQNEGQTNGDLLEILKKYINKQGSPKPYLIKNGKTIIL
jgi:hypothetical protein